MSNYKAINPYTNEVNIEYTFHTREEVDQALDILRRGKVIGRKMRAYERSQILHNLKRKLRDNRDKLAKLISKEIGKNLKESYVEVERAIQVTMYSAEEARRVKGDTYKTDVFENTNDKTAVTFRWPLGIVLGITPFNFPINLAIHKIAPAFATGNCMLLKPSLQNYESGKLLVELCHEAGFPKEMIQFIMPDIPEMSYLTAHDDINCISFTGGVPTAKAIAKNSGFKKLIFELGGNDPLIVMDDGDFKAAAQVAVNQRFGTAGQRCTSPKRHFIHSAVYDEYKIELLKLTQNLNVGDPMDPETDVGPVVNAHSADIIEGRINKAIEEGATLLAGGKREGNIIYPTILENVNLKSEIICDETFGPVIPLVKFDNIDEAIEIINSTEFGLQAGLFTDNLKTIKKVFNELEVGTVAVNDGPGFRADHLPFGGVKNSGIGREGVIESIKEFTYIKMLAM
jgi:acyl-CoA reductase-like NAD-dependent aldehyde dehydrogenase